MARGGPSAKAQERAKDELSAFDKAMRRGQRVEPLIALARYLEVPPAEREPFRPFVAGLVALWLDGLRAKAPANAQLMDIVAGLAQAPELVGDDDAGRERWWLLVRRCLAGRCFAQARRIWPLLEPSARGTALARIVEARLDQAPLSDEVLAHAAARLPAVATVDPRLGHESIAARPTLNANAPPEQVRAWVEELFTEQPSLSQVRQAARATPRVWVEAAPFLLQAALARGSAELLRGFADALEATQDPIADLDVALRWSLAELLARAGQALPDGPGAVFPRLARAFVQRAGDPRMVADALAQVAIDALPYSPELAGLLTRLLASPTPSLWLRASFLLNQPQSRDGELERAVAAAMKEVVQRPRELATALERSPRADRTCIFNNLIDHLSNADLEALLTALVPQSDTSWLLGDLALVFEALVEQYNDEARPGASKISRALRGSLHELEMELDEHIDDGMTEQRAVARVLRDAPPHIAVVLRPILLDYARRGPAKLSSAARSLWARWGSIMVRQAPSLLEDGLRYIEGVAAQVELVRVALEAAPLKSWLDTGHQLVHWRPELIVPLLQAVDEQFRGTPELWRRAYQQQCMCRCSYTKEIVHRFLIAEAIAGKPSDGLVRRGRRDFPEVAKAVDRAYPKTKQAAPKRAAAAKKTNAAGAADKTKAAKKVAEPKAKAAKKVAEPKAKAAKKVAEPKAKAAKKVAAPTAPKAPQRKLI